MSGMIVERRDHVRMTRFSLVELRASTFFKRWSSTKGPFFRLRGIVLLRPCSAAGAAAAAPANDHLVRRLVARTGTALGLAPRRHRMASSGRLALPAPERMVDRVHGHAARLGTHALPPVAARLADRHQLGLGVAHFAQGA